MILSQSDFEQTLKNGKRYTVFLPDGGNYRGEWLDNLRHGCCVNLTFKSLSQGFAGGGCMIYKNGEMYDGGWVQDRREGVGAFYGVRNGKQCLVYTGEWKQDQPSVIAHVLNQEGLLSSRDTECSMGIIVAVMKDNGKTVTYTTVEHRLRLLLGKREGFGKLMMDKSEVPIYEGEWSDNVR